MLMDLLPAQDPQPLSDSEWRQLSMMRMRVNSSEMTRQRISATDNEEYLEVVSFITHRNLSD